MNVDVLLLNGSLAFNNVGYTRLLTSYARLAQKKGAESNTRLAEKFSQGVQAGLKDAPSEGLRC